MKIYNRTDLEKTLQEHMHANPQTLEEWLNSPFYIDGDVVSEFWRYITNAPAVAVVGDYDCDGITASYIMAKSIKELYPDKTMYIRMPKRFTEGYGINKKIIEEIKTKYPVGTVVITVDNGISSGELLEDLEKDGYRVLMTDHHSLREGCSVPNVSMAIDPAVEECSKGFTFTKWCGAAVAFKLCEQMISEELSKELETFAGIATIADCMELTGGNWGLVKKTINTFRENKAPGSLKALLIGMRQDPEFANEDTFGFYLGPCFNAAGRLKDNGAMKVLKYLLKPSEEGVSELIQLNSTRKALRDEEYVLVKNYIEENNLRDKCPIWVNIPNLHEGIVGILAGQVAEEYGVPAIVTTNLPDDPDMLKGSARTAGEVNIFEYLQGLGDVFEKMGGHPGAAGLTISKENFEKVKNIPCKKPEMALGDSTVPGNAIHISTSDIPEINTVLKTYRPFGEGNPAPIFDINVNTAKDDVRMIGADKNHLCIEERGKFKVTHWFHDPNNLSDKHIFGLFGKIQGTAYCGIETPTLNADGIYDISEERSRGRGK